MGHRRQEKSRTRMLLFAVVLAVCWSSLMGIVLGTVKKVSEPQLQCCQKVFNALTYNVHYLDEKVQKVRVDIEKSELSQFTLTDQIKSKKKICSETKKEAKGKIKAAYKNAIKNCRAKGLINSDDEIRNLVRLKRQKIESEIKSKSLGHLPRDFKINDSELSKSETETRLIDAHKRVRESILSSMTSKIKGLTNSHEELLVSIRTSAPSKKDERDQHVERCYASSVQIEQEFTTFEKEFQGVIEMRGKVQELSKQIRLYKFQDKIRKNDEQLKNYETEYPQIVENMNVEKELDEYAIKFWQIVMHSEDIKQAKLKIAISVKRATTLSELLAKIVNYKIFLSSQIELIKEITGGRLKLPLEQNDLPLPTGVKEAKSAEELATKAPQKPTSKVTEKKVETVPLPKVDSGDSNRKVKKTADSLTQNNVLWEKITQLNVKISNLEESSQASLSTLRAQVDTLESEKKVAEAEVKNLNLAKETAIKEVDVLRMKYENLNQQLLEAQKSSGETIADLNAQILNLTQSTTTAHLEIDQLRQQIIELGKDRANLKSDNAKLTQDNHNLSQLNKQLAEDKQKLETTLKSNQQETEKVVNEINGLKGKVGDLEKENESLNKQKTLWEGENKAAIQNHARLNNEVKILVNKNRDLSNENAKLESQNQTLSQEKAKVEDENQKLSQKSAKIESENQQLMQEKANLEKEKQAAEAQVAPLIAQNQNLTHEIITLKQQLSQKSVEHPKVSHKESKVVVAVLGSLVAVLFVCFSALGVYVFQQKKDK